MRQLRRSSPYSGELLEIGFNPEFLRDGLEAVQKAMAEPVDLVILDLMMPGLNGYQACRVLKGEPAMTAGISSRVRPKEARVGTPRSRRS